MRRCARCRTVFAEVVSLPEVIDRYEAYYNEVNLGAPELVKRSLARIVAGFEQYRRTGRLLDVGFGSGISLEIACAAGWAVSGIEVSAPAIEQARSKGFDVVHARLEDAGLPSGAYDVVMAAEVIEHVEDPLSLLREMTRLVRPGGLVWLTTPNGNGISMRLLRLDWSVVSPPEHLQLFTRVGVEALLAASGLRTERIVATGVNPIELLNALRPRSHRSQEFDRVQSGYALLAQAHRRRSLRLAKAVVDRVLSVFSAGDSLRIWATRQSEKGFSASAK